MAMAYFLSPIVRIRHATQKRLVAVTPQSRDFYILISFSAALATLGLLMDNTAVVIGAMVVAPLVTPIFTFSLSLLVLEGTQLWRSCASILFGSLVAIAVAALLGWAVRVLLGTGIVLTPEILSRSKPDTLYFLVAILSGMVGSYAYARPKILEFVTGVAIAVAIIPPIAVIGIALSLGNTFLFQQSALLYVFNVCGICLGSMMMFVCLGFGKEIEKT